MERVRIMVVWAKHGVLLECLSWLSLDMCTGVQSGNPTETTHVPPFHSRRRPPLLGEHASHKAVKLAKSLGLRPQGGLLTLPYPKRGGVEGRRDIYIYICQYNIVLTIRKSCIAPLFSAKCHDSPHTSQTPYRHRVALQVCASWWRSAVAEVPFPLPLKSRWERNMQRK